MSKPPEKNASDALRLLLSGSIAMVTGPSRWDYVTENTHKYVVKTFKKGDKKQ